MKQEWDIYSDLIVRRSKWEEFSNRAWYSQKDELRGLFQQCVLRSVQGTRARQRYLQLLRNCRQLWGAQLYSSMCKCVWKSWFLLAGRAWIHYMLHLLIKTRPVLSTSCAFYKRSPGILPVKTTLMNHRVTKASEAISLFRHFLRNQQQQVGQVLKYSWKENLTMDFKESKMMFYWHKSQVPLPSRKTFLFPSLTVRTLEVSACLHLWCWCLFGPSILSSLSRKTPDISHQSSPGRQVSWRRNITCKT